MTVNFVRVLNHKDAINVEKIYDYKKMIKPYMILYYITCYYNNFNRKILSKTKLVVSGTDYDSYFNYITLL